MAQIIRLKRSTVAGSVPTTSDLSTGELAINVHDGKVFLRRSGSVDDVRQVLTNEYTGSVNITGSVTATEFIGDGSGLTNLTIAQTATVRQAFEGTTWNINHNLDTNNPIAQIWKEADTLLDYTLALWVTALSMMAFSGILVMIFELVTNPSKFNNATFGIFDTLGS